MYENYRHQHPHRKGQRHVHEIQGDVKIAGRDPHTHRFATVSGEAIALGNSDHVHEVVFRTDFFKDHYHEFRGRTSGAIRVGDRHVHFLKAATSFDDGHSHPFRFSTFIEDATAN